MPPGVRDVRGRLQVPPSQQRIHITLGIPGTTGNNQKKIDFWGFQQPLF